MQDTASIQGAPKAFDVTTLGEILIDFTPAGLSPQGNFRFERNPGGAPANVAVCLSRLGLRPAFIGKVGEDMFGRYLHTVLKDNGVEVSGMRSGGGANTTLAFVQLDENGDRSFSFYRNPGADTALEAKEVDFALIGSSRVFHFGSLSLTDEPSRTATLAALEHARASGCTVSFDPNLRPPLWKSLDTARERITSVLEKVDILKLSKEELEFATGSGSLAEGTEQLYQRFGISLILVTLGAEGSYYRMGERTGLKGTFSSIKAVDTTGAGDAFLGGFLYSMLSAGFQHPRDIEACARTGILSDMLAFAAATASLCVARKGAIPAMPALDEVTRLIGTEVI